MTCSGPDQLCDLFARYRGVGLTCSPIICHVPHHDNASPLGVVGQNVLADSHEPLSSYVEVYFPPRKDVVNRDSVRSAGRQSTVSHLSILVSRPTA